MFEEKIIRGPSGKKKGPKFAALLSVIWASGTREPSKKFCVSGSCTWLSKNVLVFAAASLTDVLRDLSEIYHEESGIEININFGASQMLAQQLRNGAPGDLFLPAGESPASYLIQEGVSHGKPTILLTNKLVFVARKGEPTISSLKELYESRSYRVAIASPKLAPAGYYAQEALIHMGIWESIQDKIMIGMDVRAALTYVEMGNADLGIVYKTDALSSSGLTILDLLPVESYSPIVYPAVIIESSPKKELVQNFIEFLESERAYSKFKAHGFELKTR